MRKQKQFELSGKGTLLFMFGMLAGGCLSSPTITAKLGNWQIVIVVAMLCLTVFIDVFVKEKFE